MTRTAQLVGRGQKRPRIKCTKCGKEKPETEFYKLKAGVRTDICKDCLTQYIDVKKPDTFLWIMKELDIPYIEQSWVSSTQKIYKRDPEMFKPGAAFGAYYRVMLSPSFRKYGWEDSTELNESNGRSFVGEDKEKAEKYNEELRGRLEAGEITENQFLTLRKRVEEDEENIKTTLEEKLSSSFEESDQFAAKKKAVDDMAAKNQALLDRMAKIVTTAEKQDYLRQGKTKDPVPQTQSLPSLGEDEEKTQETHNRVVEREKEYADKLSDDEKTALAIKWGDNYSIGDWIRMEQMYREYEDTYEMNVDRKETLKIICKTSLKLDQALDSEDTAAAQKLSTMLDQLRKSAKFTDAQNKEEKQRDIDCVGELVAAVEREGGIIEQFDFDIHPVQDKVDLVLKDNQAYIYNLVKKDLGLGDLIESYIQKLEKAEEERENNQGNLGDDLIVSSDQEQSEEEKNDAAAQAWSDDLEDAIRRETESLFGEGNDD